MTDLIFHNKRAKTKLSKNVTLVADAVVSISGKCDIVNFVLVDGNPIYNNRDKHLKNSSIQEYKKSKKRGLFYYASYADVIKLNQSLKKVKFLNFK